MIAASRLRRVERFFQAEKERQTTEIVERALEILRLAEICRMNGDPDNDVVRRADRMEELIELALQRKAEHLGLST